MLLEILLHHDLGANRAQIATQRVAARLELASLETPERKIFIVVMHWQHLRATLSQFASFVKS